MKYSKRKEQVLSITFLTLQDVYSRHMRGENVDFDSLANEYGRGVNVTADECREMLSDVIELIEILRK